MNQATRVRIVIGIEALAIAFVTWQAFVIWNAHARRPMDEPQYMSMTR